MNFSVYFFGDFGSGYTQCPDDFARVIFKSVSGFSAKSQIAIRRDGNVIYYVYVRQLDASQGRQNYIGISIAFNSVFCDDIKALFSVFEETVTNLVVSGKILEFNDSGEIYSSVTNLSFERAEIDRISDSLESLIKKIPSDSFKILPPVNYSSSSSAKETLKESATPAALYKAINSCNNIDVLKNSDYNSLALSGYSNHLYKLNSTIKSLKKENANLSEDLARVKRQKKRTTVVTILSLLVAVIVIILISVGTNLTDKVNTLSNNVHNMQETIDEKDKTVERLNGEITLKDDEIISLKRDLSYANEELKLANSRAESLSSVNAELDSKVSSLLSQKRSLENQVSNLQSQINNRSTYSSSSRYSSSTSSSYSTSSARTVYTKEFSMKVGEHIKAKLSEGSVSRWEVTKNEAPYVRDSGDELIALKKGTIHIWGYVNSYPKMFNIVIN